MAYNHRVVSLDGNLNFWCPTTILDFITDSIASAAAFHQPTDDRRKETDASMTGDDIIE